ncbi:MAG: hypothetical protein AMXMBFR36_15560 [Acidobacteriota bacterium]
MQGNGWPRSRVGLLLGLAVAPPATAQSYDFSAATALLEQNLDAFPGGVFVQLFQEDREIFTFQFGEIDADTRLRAASASKWLSSAIVLRLVESGEIALDDRVGDALPIFDLHGKGDVTLEQGFAMTSGLYETTIDFETAPWLTLEQAANLIAVETPMVFPSGTQLAYEGDGMAVVGRVAEVATGAAWRDLAAQELAAPLGMTTLDYDLFPVNPGVPGGARLSAADYQELLRTILRGGRARDGSSFLAPVTVAEWFVDRTLGLPEYDSPWPPFPYPYGERPDYGLGSWILARDPASGRVEEVASPGKFGTFPWIDRKRRLRGIVATDSVNGFAESVLVDLALLDRLRAAIDAVLVFTDGFENATTDAWSPPPP